MKFVLEYCLSQRQVPSTTTLVTRVCMLWFNLVSCSQTLLLFDSLYLFRSIGLKFGVVKSVARECVFRVIDALLEVNQERKIILWPNAVEANGIIQEFLDKTKFPG